LINQFNLAAPSKSIAGGRGNGMEKAGIDPESSDRRSNAQHSLKRRAGLSECTVARQ
jgi:hypothetical protein